MTTDEKGLVSVLVVTWRTPTLAERCVRHVLAELDHLELQVVVVDNHPADGTTDRLTAAFGADERVRVIPSPTNLGYAAGNNLALARCDGDQIVVMNPDITVQREAVDVLLSRLRIPAVGIASCTLRAPDGMAQTIHRRFPDLPTVAFVHNRVGAMIDHRLMGRRFVERSKMLDRPRVGIGIVDQVAGAFFAIRRATVAGPLGGTLFDDRLPILMNDVDLSRRVRDAGLCCEIVWDQWVDHEGGASLRQVDEGELRQEFWSGMTAYFDAHEGRVARLAVRAFARLDAITGRPAPSLDDASCLEMPGGVPQAVTTIVIPTYNYGRFLTDAVDSALAQTERSVEVVVVDDGSTDETPLLLAAYGDRIAVHRQINAGLSAARNVGARLARGEYIVYLDADNRLDPRFVERCREALECHPAAGFAYPQARHFGDIETVTNLQTYDIDQLLEGNEIDACALIRRRLVCRYPFDESNRIGWEDWDFWLTLAEHGWGGVLVDEPLMEYRRHGSSMTGGMDALSRRRQRFRVLARHRRLAGTARVARAGTAALRLRVGLARRRLNR
ncbi:MAG: glycosyltransferase [Actinomycetota bacterium]|nr:glycosyltransferase [Actinomycetota bacterium]